MILTCPTCSTRFEVEPALIGNRGRRVRCSKCGQIWHATIDPNLRIEAALPDDDRELAPRAREDHADDLDLSQSMLEQGGDSAEAGEPPVAADAYEEPLDGSRIPELMQLKPRRIRTLPALPSRAVAAWTALLIVVGGLGAGAVQGREMVLATWPPAARLYDVIGLPVPAPGARLTFDGVRSETRVEEGRALLVVEGQIRNDNGRDQPVPPVVISALGADGAVVERWEVAASHERLLPGEIATFQSVQDDIAAVTRELHVTFSAP